MQHPDRKPSEYRIVAEVDAGGSLDAAELSRAIYDVAVALMWRFPKVIRVSVAGYEPHDWQRPDVPMRLETVGYGVKAPDLIEKYLRHNPGEHQQQAVINGIKQQYGVKLAKGTVSSAIELNLHRFHRRRDSKKHAYLRLRTPADGPPPEQKQWAKRLHKPAAYRVIDDTGEGVWLTPVEAAAKLKISVASVYKYVRCGWLAIHHGGSKGRHGYRITIPESEVADFIRERLRNKRTAKGLTAPPTRGHAASLAEIEELNSMLMGNGDGEE